MAREAVGQGALTPAAADALAASLYARADAEQRAATLRAAEPSTGNADQQQSADQGQAHDDTAADLAAAGDRQRSLMSQTFPQLTEVGGAPARSKAKPPITTTPAQRKAKTR
jgi:hypothetical protein